MPTDEKPSKNEEQYFARHNADLIREQRARLDEIRSQGDRASHYMKCPKCGGELAERSFHHIKVDECADCGGIWLDKGEIAMIEHVERRSVSGFVERLLGLNHS